MLPETLEILAYLNVNRKWWDIHDVANIMNKFEENPLESAESDNEDEDDNDYNF